MDNLINIHRDLSENYSKAEIYLLADFYELDTTDSQRDLLWKITILNYYRQKAEMKGGILFFLQSLDSLVNAGRSDQGFPQFDPDYIRKIAQFVEFQKDFDAKMSALSQIQKAEPDKKAEIVAEKRRLNNELKISEEVIKTHPEWAEINRLRSRFEESPQHYKWVIQLYSNGGVKRLEDISSRLLPAVKDLEWLKQQGVVDKSVKAESFNSLGKLEDYLDNYATELEPRRGVVAQKESAREGAEEIYNGSEIRIIYPKTEAAACYYGQGTRWCTAAKKDNMFEEYNSRGEMYIIIPKNPTHSGEKYQLHFATNQYMDEKDEEIDLYSLYKKYQSDFDNTILKNKIKEQLLFKLVETGEIQENDLESIENLAITNNQEYDFFLKNIHHFKNLQELNLAGTKINDLTPLSALPNLEKLNLESTGITNLNPLINLLNLTNLDISATKIVDITPLSALKKLKSLDIHVTRIQDLTPLLSLPNLEKLNIANSRVENLKPLENLINLKDLVISNLKNIDNIESLSNLKNLKVLVAFHTMISDLSPLVNLTNLQELRLSNTPVSNIEPLKNLINLEILDLDEVKVSDISPLQSLINLQKLHLFKTQVKDISPLQSLTNLQTLELSDTPVSDISPLANLTNLQSLLLSRTQVSDISPLKDLGKLEYLNLTGTRVSDISPLQSLSNLQVLILSGTRVRDITPLSHLDIEIDL